MGGRLNWECLGLGSFAVPRESRITGFRRELNSFSQLPVEASNSPACTHTHLLGTGVINPERGRGCQEPTAPNPEVGSPSCQT